MKISDLLDLIEDDSVSLREREIIASERIREVTMKKLHTEEHDYPVTKKRARRGTTLVILAAALLALSATALASGLLEHVVRWDATEIEEPSATPMPTNFPMTAAFDEAQEQAIGDALAQNQGRDLVIASIGDRAGTIARTEKLSSPEELTTLLMEKNSVLTVPIQVPEGFSFSRGNVSYDLSEGYDYELKDTQEREGGLVVERYTAPEEGDIISAYTLVYVNAAGEELSLSAMLEENSESAGFGVRDGDRVQKLAVKEMDNALLIEYPEYRVVFLRKALPSPISYVFPLGMLREPAEPVNEFDGIMYRVWSDAADGEELISTLAPLNPIIE